MRYKRPLEPTRGWEYDMCDGGFQVPSMSNYTLVLYARFMYNNHKELVSDSLSLFLSEITVQKHCNEEKL